MFRDIVNSVGIYYDPKHSEYDTDIPEDKTLLEIYKEFNSDLPEPLSEEFHGLSALLLTRKK